MTFNYDHIDYKPFLEDMATTFESTFDGEYMHFNTKYAVGYLQLINIEGGLQAIISNYTSTSDIVLNRLAKLPEAFVLRIDLIHLKNSGTALEIGSEMFEATANVYAGMLVSSSRYSFKMRISSGSVIKGVAVMLKKDLIENYFPSQKKFDWITYTHTMRIKGINRVPLNFEMRQSLINLVALKNTDPRFIISVQARIYELASHYYNQIIRQQNMVINKDIMENDVAKIIELDVFFTDSIAHTAHLPSITEMAAAANMSPTKLKVLFKKLYNQSVVEYFNSYRLNAARNLLLQGICNIKEVSAKFGFNTVQHFTTSFKKEFDITPAFLLKSELA